MRTRSLSCPRAAPTEKRRRSRSLDPSAKKLGITINQDSIPDAWPAIKSQVAGDSDLGCGGACPSRYPAAARGLLEGNLEITTAPRCPRPIVFPTRWPYELFRACWPTVKKYTAEAVPNSWADFWDVKKFPGRRALRNHPIATLGGADRQRCRAGQLLARRRPRLRKSWRSSPTSRCGGPRVRNPHSSSMTGRLTW